MIVGILKEIKPDENRVSLLPTGVEILSRNGNKVLVEKDAGIGSGFPNELYEKYGAEIIDSAEEIYKQAELIIKVKEPLLEEYSLIQKIITKEMLKKMKPGSVIAGVSIDQGGCFETSRPTTHHAPVYIVDNIVHYCVANMPGAVPFEEAGKN